MGLNFYNVDSAYCVYLEKYDTNVPYVANGKERRPFVGILITINSMDYYAPLTSPKPKHLTMKNSHDFIKIDGGRWGAINLNKMIPVDKKSLKICDMNIGPNDPGNKRAYKFLLKKQLNWCNANGNQIISKAIHLHKMITQRNVYPRLKERCCDFSLLEHKCLEYNRLTI